MWQGCGREQGPGGGMGGWGRVELLTQIFSGTVSEATGGSPEWLSLQQLHDATQLTKGSEFQHPSPHLWGHGGISEACSQTLKVHPQLLGSKQTVQQKQTKRCSH